MKTILTLKQHLLKTALTILIAACSIITNARSISNNGEVPRKPASFSAKLNNNNKVDLKWSTEIEKNMSHFVIENSTDGINFSDAALVFAFGNTTEPSNYSFAIDFNKTKSVVVYYRLRLVAADGKSQYSDNCIVTVNK